MTENTAVKQERRGEKGGEPSFDIYHSKERCELRGQTHVLNNEQQECTGGYVTHTEDPHAHVPAGPRRERRSAGKQGGQLASFLSGLNFNIENSAKGMFTM